MMFFVTYPGCVRISRPLPSRLEPGALQKLKGHLDIMPQYVIPHEDPWPLPIQGTPVGFYLNTIKAQKELLMEHYPDR